MERKNAGSRTLRGPASGKGGEPLSKSRSPGFDVLRGLLIFLVVFGHLLEPQYSEAANFLYLTIYSFHMPAFVFLSGWFSRTGTLGRALTGILLPYLVFQLLYLLFAGQPVQFHSPYWILWYLFALFLWRLLALALRSCPPPVVRVLVPVSVAVSLLCGYADWISYDYALSRVLVFLPYFLLGLALSGGKDRFLPAVRRSWSRYLSLAAALVCTDFFWHVRMTFHRAWMFGATGYTFSGTTPKLRLLLLLAALAWIWLLLAWMPQRKFPGLSVLGRNTLFVYLLHGFFKLYVDAHAETIFHYGAAGDILLALLLAAALCVLFGNRWLAGAWRWLMQAGKSLLWQISRR